MISFAFLGVCIALRWQRVESIEEMRRVRKYICLPPFLTYDPIPKKQSPIDDFSSTNQYWVLVAATSDPRPRVALEALGRLTRVSDAPSCWWRAREAEVTPPLTGPDKLPLAELGLSESDRRGLIARAGSPTAAFATMPSTTTTTAAAAAPPHTPPPAAALPVANLRPTARPRFEPGAS